LDAYGSQISGITEIAQLTRLSQVALYYDRATTIPKAILDRITTLFLAHSANTREEFVAAAAMINLRTVSVPRPIDPESWTALSRSNSLREIRIQGELGEELMIPSGIIYPRVTALYLPIENVAEALRVFSAFPNLRDLSVSISNNALNAQDETQLLDTIATHYQRLHSLTIFSLYGDKSFRYSFPSLKSLATLRLELEYFSPANVIAVDINSDRFPSLRSLVIDSWNLTDGQLRLLPHLDSLVITAPTTESLEEIKYLPHLETLGLVELSPPKPGWDRLPPASVIQEAIRNSTLRRLIIVGDGILYSINSLPPTVKSLDSDGLIFQLSQMDPFSFNYFSDTYH
jgi:hypothetical protein